MGFGKPLTKIVQLRLRLHEDVFASKHTLSYAFTLPVYTKSAKTQTGNENVFKSGYPG